MILKSCADLLLQLLARQPRQHVNLKKRSQLLDVGPLDVELFKFGLHQQKVLIRELVFCFQLGLLHMYIAMSVVFSSSSWRAQSCSCNQHGKDGGLIYLASKVFVCVSELPILSVAALV